MPASHPLAGRAELGLGELSTEPFVMLRPSSLLRQQTVELCERAGFRPSVAFEGDDLPTVRGLVAAGLGVALVPAAHGVGSELVAGSLRHVPVTDPLAVREIGLAWSAERRLLPAAELFRQHVIARAKARRLPR
jgi:DNA-binding transcriptional LysR family regulator